MSSDGSRRGELVEDEPEQHEALIAARVIDPREYSPTRRALWQRGLDALTRDGVAHPPIYPGSIDGVCCDCGVRIAIGPRQTQAMNEFVDAGRAVRVMCLLCASLVSARANVQDLGNSYLP